MTDPKDMDDLLDKITDWMRRMKEHISVDSEINVQDSQSEAWFSSMYEWSLRLSEKNRQKVGERLAQTDGGVIFTEYTRILTDGGTKILDPRCDNYASLVFLRSVCWNYSHSSFALCLELGKAGTFDLVVADLLTYETSVEEGMRNDVVTPCIAILHNCAKVPENFKYLKQANVLKAVLPYTKIEDSDLLRYKVEAILTLSYIVEDRNNEAIMADGSVLKFILYYLKNAVEKEEHLFGGFSAEELVNGLSHLANNDENKVSIGKTGVFPMLLKLLKTGSDYERTLSVGLMWTLSFAKENQMIMQKDKSIMKMLERLKDKPGKIGKLAAGALWTLKEKEQESLQTVRYARKALLAIKAKFSTESSGQKMVPKPEVTEGACANHIDSTSEHGHVMISYNWKYQKLMIKIKERLEKLNYDVWLDIEKMEGSITDCMAEAVKNSAVVLMAISKRYEQSQNCRAEAEYAFKKKKTRIPLMVEQDYEPDGWLDLLLGSLLYIDFIDEKAFEDAFSQLLKQIGDRGKKCNADEVDGPIQQKTHQVFTSGKSDSSNKVRINRLSDEPIQPNPQQVLPSDKRDDSDKAISTVDKWTEKHVEQWAAENDIDPKNFQDVGGDGLVILCEMMRDAPGNFFDHVRNDMGMGKLQDIAKLKKALRILKIEEPSTSTYEK